MCSSQRKKTLATACLSSATELTSVLLPCKCLGYLPELMTRPWCFSSKWVFCFCFCLLGCKEKGEREQVIFFSQLSSWMMREKAGLARSVPGWQWLRHSKTFHSFLERREVFRNFKAFLSFDLACSSQQL